MVAELESTRQCGHNYAYGQEDQSAKNASALMSMVDQLKCSALSMAFRRVKEQ